MFITITCNNLVQLFGCVKVTGVIFGILGLSSARGAAESQYVRCLVMASGMADTKSRDTGGSGLTSSIFTEKVIGESQDNYDKRINNNKNEQYKCN